MWSARVPAASLLRCRALPGRAAALGRGPAWLAGPAVCRPEDTRQPAKPRPSVAAGWRGCSGATSVARGPEGSSATADVALERFRRRGGPELAALAGAGAGGISAPRLRQALEEAARAELEAAFGPPPSGEGAAPAAASTPRGDCERRAAAEIEEAVAIAGAVEEGHRERTKLRATRADILAVGFQTTGAENQEFASLIVCATAGIFAVSIHWGFFSIWLVAYLLYRRSTKQVREQRAAVDDLQGLMERLRQVEEAEEERRAALRTLSEAWSAGRQG